MSFPAVKMAKVRIEAGENLTRIGGVPVVDIDGVDFADAATSATVRIESGKLPEVELTLWAHQLNSLLLEANVTLVVVDRESGDTIRLEHVHCPKQRVARRTG